MEIGFLAAMTAEGGDIAGIARATDAAGFDSLWIPEHPIIPAKMKTMFPFTDNGKLLEHYGRWADPFIGLCASDAGAAWLKMIWGRMQLVGASTAASDPSAAAKSKAKAFRRLSLSRSLFRAFGVPFKSALPWY